MNPATPSAGSLADPAPAARELEQAASHDRGLRLLHLDDYPGAGDLAGILPDRVARSCRAIVLDAGPDRGCGGWRCPPTSSPPRCGAR